MAIDKRLSESASDKTLATHFVASSSYKLFERLCRFCQQCVRNYWFWVIVALFALLEPVLCAQYPTQRVIRGQIAILALSTFLYFIQLIGVATREWEKIVVIEAMSRLGTISIKNPLKDFTPLKLLVFFSAEGEYVLEGLMILLGWIFIAWRPGLATLRCFRVFRILWFYEVEVFRETTTRVFSPILGEVFVTRGFKVLKFAINSLTALGNEMFRLTGETRGALLLMMMFFYSAFVLGATLFIETKASNDLCDSFGLCTWTLIRLTFFDGDGLDFAFYLTSKHRILFFIIMVYLCITAFGILNGLVGVFGTALARASHLAFEEEETDVNGGESVVNARELEQDDFDDDDYDRDEGAKGKGEERDALEGEDESVGAYKDDDAIFRTINKSKQSSQTSMLDVRPSVRDMLKGSSSRYLIEHFSRQQKEHAHPQPSPHEEIHTRPRAGPRMTMRDLVMSVQKVGADGHAPAAHNSPFDTSPQHTLKTKPSAFANMFAPGGNGAAKPLPAKSSRNLLGSTNHGASMYGAGGEVSRQMMNNIVEMHQMIDKQSKAIALLTSHVTLLTKQLAQLLPEAGVKDMELTPFSSFASPQKLPLSAVAPTPILHSPGAGETGMSSLLGRLKKVSIAETNQVHTTHSDSNYSHPSDKQHGTASHPLNNAQKSAFHMGPSSVAHEPIETVEEGDENEKTTTFRVQDI